MEVTGTLKELFETQNVSDRFKKRELVITTEGNTPYPQHVSFQLTQEKCDLVHGWPLGIEVKAQFNLRGREWNGPQGVKYFNTLEIWRIEKVGGTTNNTTDNYTAPKVTPTDYNDDLPF